MKRISLYTTTLFLIISQFFLPFHCYGHGFDGNTLVSIVDQSVDLYPIRLVCEDVVEDGQSITSFDFVKQGFVKRPIRSAGKSETDYHVAISFNDEWWEDITCTATQEFYVVHAQQWIPACQLKIGDILFSKQHEVKRISKIRFFKEPRTVYAIHVKGTHIFFVGTNQILTHNMVLPAISIGLGIAFGTGAAAGGSMGGVLGPITLSCGAILGGLFGIGIKKFFGPADVPCYGISVYPDKLGHALFNEQIPTQPIPKPIPPKEKEDDKAPGKPKNNEVPTKDSDEEKIDETKHKPGGLTNREARRLAEVLGYKEDKNHPFDDHGKLVFKDPKRNIWISPDRDGHNGGIWKEFDKKKQRRTLDAHGKPIGK